MVCRDVGHALHIYLSSHPQPSGSVAGVRRVPILSQPSNLVILVFGPGSIAAVPKSHGIIGVGRDWPQKTAWIERRHSIATMRPLTVFPKSFATIISARVISARRSISNSVISITRRIVGETTFYGVVY